MKKIISKIKFLNLSLKKEIIIFSVINFAFIAGFIVAGILLNNLVFYGFCLGIPVVFSIFYINRYDKMIAKINNENLIEFAELFGFFRIYIKNGYNVYNGLKEISKFANENLKDKLLKLIAEIDKDKSVQPFVNFAKNFNEIIIEELMISIYQMVDDGEQSNYLVQFEFMFDKFSEELDEKQLQKKNSILGTLSSAPLIGSCFLIIVVTIGIIGLIGDITNGI